MATTYDKSYLFTEEQIELFLPSQKKYKTLEEYLATIKIENDGIDFGLVLENYNPDEKNGCYIL